MACKQATLVDEFSTETMYAEFDFTPSHPEQINGPYHLKRYTVDYRMYKRANHNAQ